MVRRVWPNKTSHLSHSIKIRFVKRVLIEENMIEYNYISK